MLFDRPATPTRATTVDFIQDLPREYDSDSDIDIDQTSADETTTLSDPIAPASSTLVHRPKQPDVSAGFETDSSSEDEGFSIVHRPKPRVVATPNEPMSSPEIIPSQPVDILALTGSKYPDDDDWDML
jgi:hypothetical protein